MLIVGSHALNRAIGPVRAKPLDIDIIGTIDEAMIFIRKSRFNIVSMETPKQDKLVFKCDKAIVELESTDNVLSKRIYEEMLKTSDGGYTSLDWLYFLKMSHRYKKDSHHFMKTMNDIHMMRHAGASMPEGSEELFKLRELETYSYKHPDLTVDKDKFFKKEESFYRYDHDDIHKAVAVGDVPAYTHYIADGEQVKCDFKKFDDLPHIVRLQGVLEESYVLALERAIIPSEGRANPRTSFNIALEKVCTSITSGWFREFAWENYFAVQRMYNPDFVGKFNKALEEGKIGLFDRSTQTY